MPGVSAAPADVVRAVTDQYDTAVSNVDALTPAIVEKVVRFGIRSTLSTGSQNATPTFTV